MTDGCLASNKGPDAALTRTVTGAILAPHETQRRVVSGKTDTYSSAAPGKSKCASIDPGGEMVTHLTHGGEDSCSTRKLAAPRKTAARGNRPERNLTSSVPVSGRRRWPEARNANAHTQRA